MKFDNAVEQTKQELLSKCKDVVYKGYEIVNMTRNTTISINIRERFDINVIDVMPIKNRFEIDGEIKAIKVVFDVKYPGEKKYNHYEEYYKIAD